MIDYEIFYKTMMHNSLDGVHIVNASGKVVDVNQKLCDALGYTCEEIQDMNLSDWSHLAPFDEILISSNNVEGNSFRLESVLRRKDGLLLDVEVSVTVIEIAERKYFFVTTRDITERNRIFRALAASEERYHSVFNLASDGILLLDLTGKIIEVNDAFARMHGYEPKDMEGMSLKDLDPPDVMEKVPERMNQVLKNGSHVFEVENYHKDGHLIPMEVSACLVVIEGKQLVQSFSRDISERKRLQRELLDARESTYRDALIREVHHRIKNNLQGIIGVLRMGIDSGRSLEEIINSAIQKIQSISLLLGLQGKSDSSTVSVCELVESIASVTGKSWAREIKVNTPADWQKRVLLDTESVPVALILNELINNAIKNSSDEIDIHLGGGPGIPKVVVSIFNKMPNSDTLEIEKPQNWGTGLQLVSSLMPKFGASLAWVQHEGKVETRLTLEDPVVSVGSKFKADRIPASSPAG